MTVKRQFKVSVVGKRRKKIGKRAKSMAIKLTKRQCNKTLINRSAKEEEVARNGHNRDQEQ